MRTPGHAAIGVICDGLTAFQKVAGKAKKIDTLRKLPSDLLDSMDQVTHLAVTYLYDVLVTYLHQLH